jgi:DNA mismatch repair protein MutS
VDELVRGLAGHEELSGKLRRAIKLDPPLSLREGGFILDGFDAELDRLRAIGRDGQSWLADFQRREIERTGLMSLKVGFNRVFGYYLEVPHSASDRVPPDYVRRQTVKNAERYITDELKRHEEEVLTAQERANELEYRIFERLREAIVTQLNPLLRAADSLGRLDALTGLAELAAERGYIRPEPIAPESPWGDLLEIREGRHPVLEQILSERFVPNDALLTSDEARVLVITGPNMAGKSTYIRQIALLVLMAQTGSFVPAKVMRWSLVDRLFARVGSADELARGQSTFMVEMIEAANVLRHATHRSLVILDELGRGTSTFDGLSLAWAITEHLAGETRCRTLVATHYHELTELASLLTGVKNYNVAVREYSAARPLDSIVFLHRIVQGGASKSYGIHVASLAGIPPAVIERSREILKELESGFARESRSPSLSRKRDKGHGQLPLFAEPGGP